MVEQLQSYRKGHYYLLIILWGPIWGRKRKGLSQEEETIQTPPSTPQPILGIKDSLSGRLFQVQCFDDSPANLQKQPVRLKCAHVTYVKTQ